MERVGGERREVVQGAPALLVLALVFALTGAAGVVLQVVWQREFSLLFGNTIEATGAVLAAFLGSLALGSLLLGPLADRVRRPLRLYALLEIATGLGALLTLWLEPLVETLAIAAFRAQGGETRVLSLLRAGLGFLLVAPATVPMGATLAALGAAVAGERRAGERLGFYYGLNTLGAAAGALLTAFVLVLQLGLRWTWILAALCDLGLGALLFVAAPFLAAPLPPAPGPEALPGPVPAGGPDAARPGVALGWLIALAFLSGAVILGLEVLWTRAMVVHLGSHVATFALVLGLVLLGLGAGAMVAGRLSDAVSDRISWAGVLAALAALSGLLGLVMLERMGDFMVDLVARFGVSGYWGSIAVQAAGAAQVVLLPAFLGGMVFPLALREGYSRQRPGTRLGLLVAGSTGGTLLGSLGTSLVLVPAIGVGRSFVVWLAAELFLGLLVVFQRARARFFAPFALACLASAALLGWMAAPFEDVLLAAGVFQDGMTTIRFQEDGLHGLITVEDKSDPARPELSWRSISVNGVNVAGTNPDLLATQKLQAHIPLLLHGAASSVLHIGIGSGGTAASVALYPVERIDVVELNPKVPIAADRYFRDVNRGVLFADPRISIHYGDGRNWLLSAETRWDVILSDSIHPRFAGNGTLYTRDYYQLCRKRLNPGGVASQWLPIYSLPPEAYRMIVRAFLEVFPDAILWYPHGTLSANTILVGSRDGFRFDTRAIEAQLADPRLSTDLAEIGIRSAEDLLSNWLSGPRGLARLVGDAPPHTDDRPLVEYAAGRMHGSNFAVYRNWTWAENLKLLAAVQEDWDAAGGGARSALLRRKLARYGEIVAAELP